MNTAPEEGRPAWSLVHRTLSALYIAGFLWYSQTLAYHFDEGYHLLTSQLILAGKKPYIDFCFPQVPLNAYWNAFWMLLFGRTWQVAHVFAALLTIGAIGLSADFVARRFPVRAWSAYGSFVCAAIIGLNAIVFQYGALGQPYAMCLFTLVVAFRLSVRAVDAPGPVLSGAAGLFAGAGAASSLLSAAGAPILLAWIVFHNRRGSRWQKVTAFVAAALLPFAPAVWLFCLGPQAAWFNLVRYHATFRALYWPGTTPHDLEVLTGWLTSGPVLLTGLLSLLGLLFLVRKSQWPRDLRAEFYLCAWLAAGLSFEVALAHPTFPQYFLLIVPFVAILAVPGLYAAASAFVPPDRPNWPVFVTTLVLLLGLGRTLYDARDDYVWGDYRPVADQIDRVTPRDAPLFANEPIYILTRRTPPSGLELAYSHRINLPRKEMAVLHLLTEAELKAQLQAGKFPTAYSCEADDIQEYGLANLYKQKATFGECSVFWELKAGAPPPKPLYPPANN